MDEKNYIRWKRDEAKPFCNIPFLSLRHKLRPKNIYSIPRL